jgi:hypothetical protein
MSRVEVTAAFMRKSMKDETSVKVVVNPFGQTSSV